MREQSPTTYLGLDIGTSTVRCVVGMADGDDPSKLSVIGHGSAPNLGMRMAASSALVFTLVNIRN